VFSCRRTDGGYGARLTVEGELDVATLPVLDEALRDAQAEGALVMLDLRAVDFMDAGGVHLLAAAHRRIAEAGGRLVLAGLSAAVERLLALADTQRRSLTPARTLGVAGALDVPAIDALEGQMTSAWTAGARRLAVDVRAVTVLGAPSVERLCAMLRRQTRGGVSIAIVGAPTSLRRTIELCAIDGVDVDPLPCLPTFSQ
jgi:stage II sporulation protein AA (anti-sigma F factor antagonist)